MLELLRHTPGLRIEESVPAECLTTFGVGAPVPTLVVVESVEGLLRFVELSRESGSRGFHLLGNGSNVVLPDEPIVEPVVVFGKSFELPSRFKRFVAANTPLMALSRKSALQGLSGLEFAAGIPGSIGGAVRMNAGAHGSSMSDVVSAVLVLTPEGEIEERDAQALSFSYRHSELAPGEIILGAELRLSPGSPEEILLRRQECLDYRKRTQPLQMPSSGSIFRNPSDATEPAAVYLERVGVKGERRGGVQYSELHSNWLVRVDPSARASDVEELIDLGRERVRREFGVELIPEIILWG